MAAKQDIILSTITKNTDDLAAIQTILDIFRNHEGLSAWLCYEPGFSEGLFQTIDVVVFAESRLAMEQRDDPIKSLSRPGQRCLQLICDIEKECERKKFSCPIFHFHTNILKLMTQEGNVIWFRFFDSQRYLVPVEWREGELLFGAFPEFVDIPEHEIGRAYDLPMTINVHGYWNAMYEYIRCVHSHQSTTVKFQFLTFIAKHYVEMQSMMYAVNKENFLRECRMLVDDAMQHTNTITGEKIHEAVQTVNNRFLMLIEEHHIYEKEWYPKKLHDRVLQLYEQVPSQPVSS